MFYLLFIYAWPGKEFDGFWCLGSTALYDIDDELFGFAIDGAFPFIYPLMWDDSFSFTLKN